MSVAGAEAAVARSATALPQAVLFCCDHNAVRSPMAEGLMKRRHGMDLYVQSAGVVNDLEIDGFAIAVCAELGIELSRHRTRSFEEMRDWGDDLEQFDLIVGLSEAAKDQAAALARHAHVSVEHWPIIDPTSIGRTRDEKLAAYREARDQIAARIEERFPL